MVQFLCFCSGLPSQQDRFGNTPLDEAIRNHKTAVADFLREFVTPTSNVSPFIPIIAIESHPSSETIYIDKKDRNPSFDAITIEVPNVKEYIGTMNQYFLSVNTSLSVKTSKTGLRKHLKDCGISPDDMRLAVLNALPSVFSEKDFVSIAENNEFLRKILEGKFTIPNFPAFTKQLDVFFERAKKNTEGTVFSRLFSVVNVDLFGVSVCTLDGQSYSIGDTKVKFPIANISKIVSYALALEEHGQDVHKFVGCEPSGRNSNDLILNSDGLPYNPLLDSGGIMCSSLIRRDLDIPDRFELVVSTWAKACGGKRPSFANANYLCEKDFADRNYSLGHLMKAKHLFPPETDIDHVVALYCMFNSIEITTEDLSIFASMALLIFFFFFFLFTFFFLLFFPGTLANGGVCPLTGVRVFKPSTVRNVLSIMGSCGMYDYSGEWAFNVGVPAKTSSSGALLIVVPSVTGIVAYSPRLDKYGVSARGHDFCTQFTTTFAFHTNDKVVRVNRQNPQIYQSSHEEAHIAQLCFASAKGDVLELRRILSHAVDINGADYDGRTALHMAVAENQAQAAQFLIL